MDIPNSPLNSTNRIVHESQKVDIQEVNSQPVAWKAIKHMQSPRGSQSIRRKTARTENSESTAFLGRKERSGRVSKESRAFCESLMRLIHSQTITAPKALPSHTSSGPPSLVDALHRNNARRPTQPEEIHVRREAASMCPSGPHLVGRSDYDRHIRHRSSSALRHTVWLDGTGLRQ
jgi:hypothetical protein